MISKELLEIIDIIDLNLITIFKEKSNKLWCFYYPGLKSGALRLSII